MDKEKYEEFIENLSVKYETWYTLQDIDSIITKNGIGYYPNWKHMRFLFRKNEMLICHGKSILYGCRIENRFSLAYDNKTINFPITVKNSFSKFRAPVTGDILVSADGDGHILSESIISNVHSGMNMISISLTNPIILSKYDIILSFYDPTVNTSENRIIVNGEYADFIPNKNGKEYKELSYHESIKIKNIEEISLKLRTKNKTYKVQ